jgi:hypothetical protein
MYEHNTIVHSTIIDNKINQLIEMNKNGLRSQRSRKAIILNNTLVKYKLFAVFFDNKYTQRIFIINQFYFKRTNIRHNLVT